MAFLLRFFGQSNQNGLERDITALLQKHGLGDVKLQCSMSSRSRVGYCRFEAVPEIMNLVTELGLEPVLTENEFIAIRTWEREGGCYKTAEFDKTQKNVEVFKSEQRASQLQFGKGVGFEYLLLYHNKDTDNWCMQVAYAYG